MSTREIVRRFIYPENPSLARRINSLLWTYERSRLRHSIAHEPLIRRAPRRVEESPDEAGDASGHQVSAIPYEPRNG